MCGKMSGEKPYDASYLSEGKNVLGSTITCFSRIKLILTNSVTK